MTAWVRVVLGTTSGTSGRIGLRGKWTIVSDSGQVWQPYVRANLWRDWGARATTTYSGVDLVPCWSRPTRLQLGGGLSVKMNANVSVYANADYQFPVGETDGGRRDDSAAPLVRNTWSTESNPALPLPLAPERCRVHRKPGSRT